jgi:hypothetical protein
MQTCVAACHVPAYGDYKKTAPAIQMHTALLILRLGVVRELFRPVVRNLLPCRNPDRFRRLRGDMVHKLPSVSAGNGPEAPNGLTLVSAGNRPGLPMTLQ